MFAHRAGTRMAWKPGTYVKRKRWKKRCVPREPTMPRRSQSTAMARTEGWREAPGEGRHPARPTTENTITTTPGNSHRSGSTFASVSDPYQRVDAAATSQSRGSAEKLFVSCHLRRMQYSRSSFSYGIRNGT